MIARGGDDTANVNVWTVVGNVARMKRKNISIILLIALLLLNVSLEGDF